MDFENGARTRERNQTVFHIETIIKAEQWMKPWRQTVQKEKRWWPKERTLDTARGRDKRHGGNLKLTKRPNDTKKTTIIEPRRKRLWRKWLCKIITQRTGILFFLWLNLAL